MGCLLQSFPLRSQEAMQKRMQKDSKRQRWWVTPIYLSSRHNKRVTHMNSQRLRKPAIGPTHIQVRMGPNADRIKELQPLMTKLPLIPSAHKRKKWFSAMESHCGVHTKERPYAYQQNKLNDIFVDLPHYHFFGTFLATGLLLYINDL